MTSLNKKALLIHAWMTGNIGDVLHTKPIIKYLQKKGYKVHLSGYYPKESYEWKNIIKSIDAFYKEDVVRDYDRIKRKKVFSQYEKVIFVPGPYISNIDKKRKEAAFIDIEILSELPQTKCILASHSFSMLNKEDFEILKKADVIVAREIESWNYLKKNDCKAILSADLAFLYLEEIYKSKETDRTVNERNDKKLCFLRHDNIKVEKLFGISKNNLIKTMNEILNCDFLPFRDKIITIIKISLEKIISKKLKNTEISKISLKGINQDNKIDINIETCDFATSDEFRDNQKMGKVCLINNYKFINCNTVQKLIDVILKYNVIISDRYHPAIVSFYFGKETICLPSKNDLKMRGLVLMMKKYSIENIIKLAKKSLTW